MAACAAPLAKTYTAGARIYPSLASVRDDSPEGAADRRAREEFSRWRSSFLSWFSGGDPIRRRFDRRRRQAGSR